MKHRLSRRLKKSFFVLLLGWTAVASATAVDCSDPCVEVPSCTEATSCPNTGASGTAGTGGSYSLGLASSTGATSTGAMCSVTGTKYILGNDENGRACSPALPDMRSCTEALNACDQGMQSITDPATGALVDPQAPFRFLQPQINACIRAGGNGFFNYTLPHLVMDQALGATMVLGVVGSTKVIMRKVPKAGCPAALTRSCSLLARCGAVASVIAAPIQLSMDIYTYQTEAKTLNAENCLGCQNLCSEANGACGDLCRMEANVCRQKNACLSNVNQASCGQCGRNPDPNECDNFENQCLRQCTASFLNCANGARACGAPGVPGPKPQPQPIDPGSPRPQPGPNCKYKVLDGCSMGTTATGSSGTTATTSIGGVNQTLGTTSTGTPTCRDMTSFRYESSNRCGHPHPRRSCTINWQGACAPTGPVVNEVCSSAP